MSSWHSYPSIFALGHRNVQTLFDAPVVIQEKVDGSQFSFGIFDGEVKCRSKGAQIIVDAPDSMFKKGVDYVLSIKDKLTPDWTYRGEYLLKPKHNSLTYSRIPINHIIIFDIDQGEEAPIPHGELPHEAQKIGLESVPLFHYGQYTLGVDGIKQYLERESVLGGTKIEGVVVKSLELFGGDKKRLMGKYVSEAFKEVQAAEWKENNPKGKDIVGQLIDMYKTEARWNKAIQHLREVGQITDSPKDIGMLIKEIQADILKEEEDSIKQYLFNWAKTSIQRGAISGFPEYYKQLLLNKQFAEVVSD